MCESTSEDPSPYLGEQFWTCLDSGSSRLLLQQLLPSRATVYCMGNCNSWFPLLYDALCDAWYNASEDLWMFVPCSCTCSWHMLRSCCQHTAGSMGFDRPWCHLRCLQPYPIRHCCCARSTKRTWTVGTDHPSLAEYVLMAHLGRLVSPHWCVSYHLPITCLWRGNCKV